MRQKEVNAIRDKAVNASMKYPCEDILKEKGMPIQRRGTQIYSRCYRCGHLYKGSGIPDHFSVNITKNMYHCFGCSEGGGPAKLYSKLNGLPYIDSALTLALRLGDITEEEFKSASSSADAISKFKKGEYAVRRFEEVKCAVAEVKAPANVCNAVYSRLVRLPEFRLTEEHKAYLMSERKLTEEEIEEIGFFTYSREFNIDNLFRIIKADIPSFTFSHFYGVPGFFFETKTRNSGVWHFNKPMPNCIGIPLKNGKGEIVALQMRNMDKGAKNKYFFVSSKNAGANNSNFGYGSSSGSPVAVCYPKQLTIPTFYVGEGIFKMYEVAREGAITFSVQGVNSLSYVADEIRTVLSGNTIKNIPTTLNGGEIKLVIVFDADMFEKIQVLEASLKACQHFAKEFPNKPISFLLWKGEYGKGFDDMKFYCQENGFDYHKLVRVMDKDTFLNLVKSSIAESDKAYIEKYGKNESGVRVRLTKEYSEILHEKLYLEKVRPLLP